jgi:hypothetical protein
MVTLLTCKREVPGLNSGWDSDFLTQDSRGFTQSLQAPAGIALIIMVISFHVISYSLFINRPTIQSFIYRNADSFVKKTVTE